MKIQVVYEPADGKYYIMFLDSKIKKGFGEEFMQQKWLYFGYYDEENQFNKYRYSNYDDAVAKAEKLAGPDRKVIVWQSQQ